MKKALPTKPLSRTDLTDVIEQRSHQQRKLWTRLISRLLGAIALIALVVVVALVTAHRAQSAGSAVPVQVTGTPNVNVTNASLPVQVNGTPSVLVTNEKPVPVQVSNSKPVSVELAGLPAVPICRRKPILSF